MKTERSYGLDFLKVLATIGIVFHHFQQVTGAVYEKHINFWGTWFYWGYLVEFFFILSGYFMYKYIDVIYDQKIHLSEWFLNRAKRLLPMVAISAVVYELVILAYYFLHDQSWMGIQVTVWGILITSLGIQHGWAFSDPSVNYPTWYISVLILCYVLFFVFTVIAKKLKTNPVYFYIFAVLLGCGIQTYGVSYPFFNASTARGLYAFFFGLMLAMFVKKYGLPKRVISVSVLIVAFFTLVFIFRSTLVSNELPYVLTFLLYPAIIVIFETNIVKRIFNNKLWGVAGNISFDVYLWHNPMIPLMYVVMTFFNFSIDFSKLSSMYIFTIISIIVGIFSYYLCERPLAKFVNKQIEFFRSRRAQISENKHS